VVIAVMVLLPSVAWAGCDLAVYYLLSPSNSAKKLQSVKFYPYNVGTTTINGFDARFYKNDTLLFTEHIDQVLKKNEYAEVTLSERVSFEYEEDAVVSLRLVTPGDTDESNDSTSMAIQMPKEMPYPFTWTEKNCKEYFSSGGLDHLDWQFDEGFGAYYMSDRVSNWFGTLTTQALPFPENEPVKCSFEFGTAGGDVTLFFYQDYGDNETVIDTVFVGHSTEVFSPAYFTFRAKGPAIIRISATLSGDWNASGAIYIRNICFSKADKDMMAQTILSPQGQAIATSSDEQIVRARFKNPSPMAIENPAFCYDAGSGVVREVYQGTVEAGQSVDYSFTETYFCDEVGKKSIAVWCEVEGDSDASNDTISKVLNYYEPLSFPLTSTFEEGNELWTILDVNGDGQSFVYYALNPSDSCVAFENYACTDIQEALISPAVKIPAGLHRIVFSYAGYQKSGSVNLKLYMGTTPDYSQMTELLFDRNLRNDTWETGFHLLDIQEEDAYYFAFIAEGEKDAVLLDNVSIDEGEDLGISDIRFSAITGYNLSTTDVIISYVNYGVTAQKDVTLSYMTNDEFSYVEEVNPAVINPGDTIHYTFSVPAEVEEVGATYHLVGRILTCGGENAANDMMRGADITNLAPTGLPYFNDFSGESRNAEWLMQGNIGDDGYSGWRTTYMGSAYSGMAVLKHENWTDLTADSWIYSEGIQMEKGSYEVSFFHHETSFDFDDYVQNFEVKLGQDRTAEAMNILVEKFRNVNVCGTTYEKIIRTVEIPADGIYYLGFHNTSAAGYAFTLIDDVCIEAVADGRSLPYQSDFAGADSLNWTFYNPNVYTFNQWINNQGTLVVDRTADDYWIDPEGMVVSPRLHFEAGKKVEVTVSYEVIADDPSIEFNLYGGTVNDMVAMEAIAELPRDKKEVTLVLEVSSEPKDYYLGFRSNAAIEELFETPYTLKLSSVKVNYDAASAIETLEGNQLVNPNRVFDLNGRRASARHGWQIVNGKVEWR